MNLQQVESPLTTVSSDIQHQRSEWRKKGWSIPDLLGGKQSWFSLVTELISLIGEGQIYDLDAYPQIDEIKNPLPWRSYSPSLKGLGLVCNQDGAL